MNSCGSQPPFKSLTAHIQKSVFFVLPRLIRSHLMPGIELVVLLIAGFAYRDSSSGASAYVLQNLAFILLGLSYLLPPFLYNPNGLDYGSISRGWDEWSAWM